MHAYLLTGQGITDFEPAVSKLANKLKAKILEFPLIKIEDVRNLNSLLRLSFDKPTLIFCKDIHEAGEEALNALLKNLEEPQENIFFALTSTSARRVMPTIVSRCQILRIKNDDLGQVDDEFKEIQKFLEMTTGEKLFYIDKIKDRGKAIEFAENTVNFMHRSLHENDLKYDVGLSNINLALKTLSRLKGNGNVNLQLSNFVINYNN
jgi:DNA polymerase III delta prime subunit